MINADYSTDSFDLYNISPDKQFADVLAQCMQIPGIKLDKEIRKHYHYKYFLNYLHGERSALHSKTIVVENYYTSLSYLGDYMNYHARCYRPYQKVCRRIHFFKEEIPPEIFLAMITKKSGHKPMWESYLGYIVIKPLPNGIIGPTLLEQYNEHPQRFYTVKRQFPVNLFGKDLLINTLPYQEQDGIVGSCASSALWCAFQKTAQLFNSPIVNTSEITLMAGSDALNTGKSFPSEGLEIEQICKAIQANGLISEIENSSKRLKDTKLIKHLLYSYLRMGIPVLLGLQLEDDDGGMNSGRRHLVALTGYRFGKTRSRPRGSILKYRLKSDNIEKYYAHDDQTGPFSRLEIIDDPKFDLRTSCWRKIDDDIKLKAKIKCIIVPISKTISLNFEHISNIVDALSLSLAEKMEGDESAPIQMNDFEWDIFLIESNAYKIELKKELLDSKLNEEHHFDHLFESLPQYIWVVKAYYAGQLMFDMLFDTIDTITLRPCSVKFYNSSIEAVLTKLNDEYINRMLFSR